MTTANEVYTFILAQATEEEVSRLSLALRERQKTLRSIKSSVNRFELTPGTKARLTGISPKYLNNVVVTVKGRANSKLIVQFDEATYTGRFGKEVRVSPAQLVKV